jgi:glutamate racemase
MTSPPATDDTIGVFDSGVGGLSVLRALQVRLPHVRQHYVADALYAPYGDRRIDEVIDRSERLTQHLLDAGSRMIVVACNTATTLAIRVLRSRWPEVTFVGVEPGIKPAVAHSRNGRIGVLATTRTIASERLRSLLSEHASHCTVVLQACPGLADAIEGGAATAESVDGLLRRYCAPLLASQVDTVVLGCTHYPFVAGRIQAIMGPGVRLIDTADAVAQRAQSLWPAASANAPRHPIPTLESTGDPRMLMAAAQRWIDPLIVAERVTA